MWLPSPELRSPSRDVDGGTGAEVGPPVMLGSLREEFYRCASRRADALFEVCDALLAADTVPSPVHLSLEATHRRGWGSLYAALQRGRLDEEALRDLLARHPLADDNPPVYAVDLSVWPRCDAEASPERGYYYHPSRHSAGQPIVAGWAYQWIAGLGFSRDSWVAPMDACRVHPTENANTVAVGQVEALLRRLPESGKRRGEPPLFVFDAGYDATRLTQALEYYPAQLLVRLNSRRCFYADPPERPAGTNGRPRRHGRRFVCKDPSTWPEPAAEHRCEHADYGEVRVRAWSGLHPKLQSRHGAEPYEKPPIVRGTVVLVEVQRLPRETREPRQLWLWWHGPGEPDLDLLWRAYVRRFDLEHTFRFLKEKLGWTTPKLRHPEQADLWTWLVVAAYTQLRLARTVVADRRLPWEKPLPARRLTPCRVLRAFSSLLPSLGTPARAPKPRGRSPGRPKGRLSGRATRYPAVKKAA